MKQKKHFLSAEGDAWFRRNQQSIIGNSYSNDPVLTMLTESGLEFGQVLEVGCANGERLYQIRELSGAKCCGVEPSAEAVKSAVDRGLNVKQGTADNLPFDDATFDLVIKIAAECDRVLLDGGVVVTYDFSVPTPYRNSYQHKKGFYSYKMDYSLLFSWNPAYTVIAHKSMDHGHRQQLAKHIDDQVAVTLLCKEVERGWPLAPVYVTE